MDHRLALQPALVALAIAFATPLWSAGPALAQDKMTPQQQRMKDCNATAGQRKLSGDARKTFMSECLSGDAPSGAATTSQQDKMKTCNAQASKQQLKGDARQQFMSSCLKG
jgi:hypothetical protein